jgi:hypothetical protein
MQPMTGLVFESMASRAPMPVEASQITVSTTVSLTCEIE